MVVKLSSDFITQFISSTGYGGNRPFWQNLKNIFFLNHNDFELAEKWFNKCEDKAAFFSPLLPVVRTFISSPLGYRKIQYQKTCLYSLSWIAVVFRTSGLACVGFSLGPYLKGIIRFSNGLDTIAIIVITLLPIYSTKARNIWYG